MKKRETVEEMLARLEKDPEYVAARERRDREFQERHARLAEAEAPLVEALRAAGVGVGSVWDLVNGSGDYPQAVGILFEHLGGPYPSAIRDGIARALAMPATRRHWEALLSAYRRETDSRVKDGLAAALSAIATDPVIGSVVELVENRANGTSRVLLLRALSKSKDADARAALQHAVNDPELQKEARFLLRTKKKS